MQAWITRTNVSFPLFFFFLMPPSILVQVQSVNDSLEGGLSPFEILSFSVCIRIYTHQSFRQLNFEVSSLERQEKLAESLQAKVDNRARKKEKKNEWNLGILSKLE